MCLNNAVKRSFLLPIVLCTCSAGLLAQARSNDEIGEVFASDAAVRGNMILATGGTRVLSGSQVTAGLTTARLQLTRGGYVRICPNTGLSVSGWSQRELLLAMNSGAVELHYRNNDLTDALVTPDFRIQFTGPADFHFAVKVDAAGNTCLRSLPQNTGSALVMESLGTGTYRIAPGAAVLFHRGRMSEISEPVESCGCGEPEHPVQVAEEHSDAPQEPADERNNPRVPPQAHVAMEAPFVYTGEAADPELFQEAAKLSLREDDMLSRSMLPAVKPPQHAAKTGFFHRLGRAFKHLFTS